MIKNSILQNGILLWKVRLFPVKSPFHQPLNNTSIYLDIYNITKGRGKCSLLPEHLQQQTVSASFLD